MQIWIPDPDGGEGAAVECDVKDVTCSPVHTHTHTHTHAHTHTHIHTHTSTHTHIHTVTPPACGRT